MERHHAHEKSLGHRLTVSRSTYGQHNHGITAPQTYIWNPSLALLRAVTCRKKAALGVSLHMQTTRLSEHSAVCKFDTHVIKILKLIWPMVTVRRKNHKAVNPTNFYPQLHGKRKNFHHVHTQKFLWFLAKKQPHHSCWNLNQEAADPPWTDTSRGRVQAKGFRFHKVLRNKSKAFITDSARESLL